MTQEKAITPQAVFLVSGGAKGITAQCVITLARVYQCGFILAGRSALQKNEPTWAQGQDGPALKKAIMNQLLSQGDKPTPVKVERQFRAIQSQREIKATLNAVTEAGGRAVYISADVSNQAELTAAIEQGTAQLGPVTGLIHGAGVLADKLIEQKTGADFEAVYTTKVTGLKNLLSAVPAEQLQHVVLFSSAAGFFGNVGQTDYALANEILNKTAHLIKLQHPHCRVLSINWGPWDGGMVTPQLKKVFEERNIGLIPVDEGTNLLARELFVGGQNGANGSQTNGHVQLVVGSELAPPASPTDAPLRSYRIHRTLSQAANPFLQDHVIGGHAVLPTVCATGWFANLCEQLYPGFTFFQTRNFRVLKGIVFDGSQADNYVLDLEETTKNESEIIFSGKIWSEAQPGKVRYHYSVEVTLRREIPPAPIYPVDPAILNQNLQDGAEFYRNGTLFHGPGMQGVRRLLAISKEKLVMACNLPPLSETAQGQFPVQTFNPFIADIQFQGMLIWARHFYQAGSLPLSAAQGEHFIPTPFGQDFYVTMEILRASETNLQTNIIAHNAAGQIYTRVSGAETTISPRLNELFATRT